MQKREPVKYQCAICANTKTSADSLGSGDFEGWASITLSTMPTIGKVLCGGCVPLIRNLLGGARQASSNVVDVEAVSSETEEQPA